MEPLQPRAVGLLKVKARPAYRVSPLTVQRQLYKSKHAHLPSEGFERVESPTEEQIREGCEQIQKEWSPRERLKRAGIHGNQPWRPPETRIAWDEFDERLSGVGTFSND